MVKYELTDTIVLNWEFGNVAQSSFTYTMTNLREQKPDLMKVKGATLAYPADDIANPIIDQIVNIKSDLVDSGRILVSIPAPTTNALIPATYPGKYAGVISPIELTFKVCREINNQFTFYVVPQNAAQTSIYGSLSIALEFYKKI